MCTMHSNREYIVDSEALLLQDWAFFEAEREHPHWARSCPGLTGKGLGKPGFLAWRQAKLWGFPCRGTFPPLSYLLHPSLVSLGSPF